MSLDVIIDTEDFEKWRKALSDFILANESKSQFLNEDTFTLSRKISIISRLLELIVLDSSKSFDSTFPKMKKIIFTFFRIILREQQGCQELLQNSTIDCVMHHCFSKFPIILELDSHIFDFLLEALKCLVNILHYSSKSKEYFASQLLAKGYIQNFISLLSFENIHRHLETYELAFMMARLFFYICQSQESVIAYNKEKFDIFSNFFNLLEEISMNSNFEKLFLESFLVDSLKSLYFLAKYSPSIDVVMTPQ